ncbi:glycosyltransferase family 2 protein [Desulfovermiculus halophilus]|uniref:glycosyltransferase family 2 protein n=1 Tax=Desulfovermiculus halophilus TaxID=339722 RepID=UPI0004866555|nr:glycosyltransferase family 2 protein [Desulfovermiculus halophilus]
MTPHPLPLSLAVIVLNEEQNLQRCLQSVSGLVSEIIVVDSGSTDRTVAIAEEFGARVFYNSWPGHVAQKNYALSLCSQPWVLSLDADEALSDQLFASIQSLFAHKEQACAGYWLNRKTFYLGAWIEHAWYPEWRLRLAKRDTAAWQGTNPHDKLVVHGSTSSLSGDILHYSYTDLNDHLKRTIDYGRIGAEAALDQGKRFHCSQLLFSPFGRLVKSLLFKQAWRDGWRGWIIAVSSFLTCFAKYAFMFEHWATREKEASCPRLEEKY